jgi:hypothetical protein
MNIFSHSQSTPRIQLFFIAIFLKLAASALSAVGFVLVSAAYSVTGAFVWLAFFALILIIALPGTDIYLKDRLRWLKPTAFVLAVFFCIVGLALIAVATTVGLRSIGANQPKEDLSRLMTSFDTMFGYNDGTALAQQAAVNLLDGENPYAESNVVTAMIEYHGAPQKLTPLRRGQFADIPPPLSLTSSGSRRSRTPPTSPPSLNRSSTIPPVFFYCRPRLSGWASPTSISSLSSCLYRPWFTW